ncbi:MAG: AAA family ATPase, partial [Paludibacteraceae bacterium]|nr:AAA family ATPase [Paludibacteraceae bacterium]
MNYIIRDTYLQRIIDRMHNGEVKVITGPRRCGKSWLLSHIFTDYLLSIGVSERQIIYLSFDVDDDQNQTDLLNPSALKEHLYSR